MDNPKRTRPRKGPGLGFKVKDESPTKQTPTYLRKNKVSPKVAFEGDSTYSTMKPKKLKPPGRLKVGGRNDLVRNPSGENLPGPSMLVHNDDNNGLGLNDTEPKFKPAAGLAATVPAEIPNQENNGQLNPASEPETTFILPPKKAASSESREKMNMMRLPRVQKTSSNVTFKQSSSSRKTVKSKQKKKNRVKYYEKVSYNLHLINLPWYILFLATIAPFWEWCMYALGLSSFFIITVLSVFSFYVPQLYDIVFAVDIIFAVDSLFRVLVELWRYRSGIPCIIFITPYTLTQFIADMLTILPLERAYVYLFVSDINNVDSLKWFDFFRYNRFIRLKRLFSFLSSAQREQRISERVEFFVLYFTAIVGFIQVICCAFYFLLKPDPIDFILKRSAIELKDSWIGELSDRKPGYEDSAFHHYILSYSFATAVVTTVGYGDVYPTSEWEMLLGIAAMLFGAIFLTGLFSSGLTSFELEHDGARFDLFYRVEAMMKHLVDIKTTPYYREKVLEYYDLLWNYREGVYNVELFHQLPKTMQEEIRFDMCEEMFHKSALFRDLEESFLRALSCIVQPVLYNPNMILCTKGKYAMQMIYIIQGEVLVRSKYQSNKPAAILRSGCIFGEINLFFSYPYTTNVETRTCCQLLIFEKETLFELLSLYPETLQILRGRVQERLNYLHKYYNVVGEVPLYWIEFSLGHSDNDSYNPEHLFPVTLRKGTGWNSRVTHDIIDDSRDTIIVEMPCSNKELEKEHTTVYQTAVIPNILVSDHKWLKRWHITIMLLGMYGAYLGPYCLVFKATSQFEQTICNIDAFILDWFVSTLFLIDVFVEVANATPVTGYYYKFKDGFGLKRSELSFWLDVLSAIPLTLTGTFIDRLADNKEFSILATSLRCLKLWKVLRYFNYLDNKYYNRLFIFRLLQTMTVLLYSTHFLACIVFMIACPSKSRFDPPICEQESWLRSYQVNDPDNEEVAVEKLSVNMPYLLSFYFAAATLSSAGFGDFNPQTAKEIGFLILFELISFTIIGYYTAILTSALSCTIRPQLVFQQKLMGIKQFMEHQGVSEDLQHRIIEHYYLQNLLWSGVTLPEKVYHFMYDAPNYLREDSLILEVDLSFEGVPLLTKFEPKILANIAELVRRYLIPPGTVFLRKGEVRRQMYVIGKGSVGILDDKNQRAERILETTSHFGIRDLLFGEPAHNHIKTLSYCLLYEIEFHDLDELFEKEPSLIKIIDEEKKANQKDIDAMTKEYAKFKTNYKEKPKSSESWILFPRNAIQNPKYFACDYSEYSEVFNNVRFKWAYKILLHKTVNPNGLFAKVWVSVMSFVSCFTLVFIMMESFMGERGPAFRTVQYAFDMMNYLDIYIKLHWGFYNERNILISHPVRTALHYIYEGGFFYDLFFTAPFELIIPLVTGTHILGYSKGVYWYTKMRWTRLPQILRIPAVVGVCNKIFTMRNETLVLLYFGLTIILCTITSCIAFYIACPIGSRIWEEGDENRLPFCLKDSWAAKKDGKTLVGMLERLVYGIYYTSNVIFAIGFGDLITLRKSELVLLIAMMMFGFNVDVCILANITAAEVDIDENRAKFLQSMECLEYILYRENVNHRLRRIIREHLQHTWIMSKGLQPKTLFVDLHPALESDLFREYVGEFLKRVPIFQNLPENIVRTLCQYMNKHYFLKGEQIVRSGNLESEMYVIVEGKAWVVDKENEWICTLRSGETIGESSMLYKKTQRRYSAFAGSAVEAFCLTRIDYLQVLERYPVVADHIQEKSPAEMGDVFERRVQRACGMKETHSILTSFNIPKKNESRAKKINTYIKSRLLAEPGEKDVRTDSESSWIVHMSNRIISSGTEDENLPFIYFARRYSSDKIGIPLIHPECMFLKYLSHIVVLMSFFTPMLATYEMFFTGLKTPDIFNQHELFWLHVFGETPMYLHIILQFITPFRIGEALLFCKEPGKIVYDYVMSPTRFLFDILAIFPIPFFHNLSGNWKYFHLLRTFRLVHFYKALVEKKDDLGKGIFFYKISVSMSTFLIIIHGVSCMVYGISPCFCQLHKHTIANIEYCLNLDLNKANETDREPCKCHDFEHGCIFGTWTHELADTRGYQHLFAMTPFQWYTRSFYWVASTVSTTGFGDIVPFTIPEILVSTLCTFVGAFILAIILSQFTSGISSRTKAHREYLYQVNLLTKHLGNIGTSASRREQVRAYFVKLWENSRGIPYHEAVSILPFAMQIEVNFFLYYEAIKNSTLFYHINDKTFLRQVCIRLKHTLLLPGSIIVNQGDQGNCLYFVFKGVVTGYRMGPDGVPNVIRQYHRGNTFGKYPALFFDQSYTKSYRTETTSEVLSLAQEDILELAKVFNDFSESLQFVIVRKYQPEETIECIFQKRQKRRGLFSLENTEGENLFEISKKQIEIAKRDKAASGGSDGSSSTTSSGSDDADASGPKSQTKPKKTKKAKPTKLLKKKAPTKIDKPIYPGHTFGRKKQRKQF